MKKTTKACRACHEVKPLARFRGGKRTCTDCLNKERADPPPAAPGIVAMPFWPIRGKHVKPAAAGPAGPARAAVTVRAEGPPRRTRRGAENPNARLTEKERARVLARLARGDAAFEVAADYSVATSTVYRIKYKHQEEQRDDS
jgi:hypothetical protein